MAPFLDCLSWRGVTFCRQKCYVMLIAVCLLYVWNRFYCTAVGNIKCVVCSDLLNGQFIYMKILLFLLEAFLILLRGFLQFIVLRKLWKIGAKPNFKHLVPGLSWRLCSHQHLCADSRHLWKGGERGQLYFGKPGSRWGSGGTIVRSWHQVFQGGWLWTNERRSVMV